MTLPKPITYAGAKLRRILQSVSTIAPFCASANWNRLLPSVPIVATATRRE